MLPAAKPTLSTPRSTARAEAWAMMSGERSRPVTLPGATSSAKSHVMLPGPQPTSRTEVPGIRCGSTNAAEFSAVREAWARTTDSWWPCVYTSSGCCALIMERYPPAPGKGWTPDCGSAGARRQAVFCGWPSVLPLPAPVILRMNGGVKVNRKNDGSGSGAGNGLGLFRATGIYVGAILGSGVLVLPAIAAQEAGPASLLAWALLLVFCTPVAFSFAEMSRQQPA